MNKENTEKILSRFPNFFHPEKGPQRSLICFGFPGDGWFQIIWDLCEKIEEELKTTMTPEDREQFEVLQVKEKFALLRIYTNWGTDKIYDLINQAEEESSRTCEHCGKPGSMRKGSWWQTLCDECYNKKQES